MAGRQWAAMIRVPVAVEKNIRNAAENEIVELFESSKANISEHLKHIFDSGELAKEAPVRNFRTVRQEGNRRHRCRGLYASRYQGALGTCTR